jgi:hypothetical protein
MKNLRLTGGRIEASELLTHMVDFNPLPPVLLAKLGLWERTCNGVFLWSIDYSGKSNVELLLTNENYRANTELKIIRNPALIVDVIC